MESSRRHVFAMPETTIGFFPDVGASFFLPRLDGQLGMYLALTSEQLKGPNVYYAGIGTHYLHSSSLPDLEARLAELQFNDYDSMEHRVRLVNDTIEELATGLPHDQRLGAPVSTNIRKAIDYAFHPARTDIESCLQTLDELMDMNPEGPGADEVGEWAKKTKKTIEQRSPTSVKVTFRQLRMSKRWSIAETFIREHGMAARFMEHPDFVEGVTALLIDKPKRTPSWEPKSLDEVSDRTVDEFFPDLQNQDMQLLVSGKGSDYNDSPYAAFVGLPPEQQVLDLITNGRFETQDEVAKAFVGQYKGKQGVEEKVREIVDRRTEMAEGRLILQLER